MANATGVSNYVFKEDEQAAEDALTEKLYEYALSQPKSSMPRALYNGGTPGAEMTSLARSIQMCKNVDQNQKDYLEVGKKWLSDQRRRMSDKDLLKAIKNDPVFRRRLITLENPETFYDPFWNGL